MTTNEVSPNPETEMTNALDKISSLFMRMSSDYRQMQETVKSINERLQSLVSQNDRLHDEVNTLVAERDKAQAEAKDNANLANSYSNDLDKAKAENTNLRSSLDKAYQDIQGLQGDIGQWSNKHYQVSADLRRQESEYGYCRTRAENAEDLAKAAEDKLAKLQAQFKAIFEPEADKAKQDRKDDNLTF